MRNYSLLSRIRENAGHYYNYALVAIVFVAALLCVQVSFAETHIDYVDSAGKHYVVVEKDDVKEIVDVTEETRQGDVDAIVAKVCRALKKQRCVEKR